HAGAACAALQAEFEGRGSVRPHGRPSTVARCAAEPGHAELRGDAPLSRDAGRAERKTEPGEYGGQFQIHFIPKVIQPFVALFWRFRSALIWHAVSSSSTTNTLMFCPGWAAL